MLSELINQLTEGIEDFYIFGGLEDTFKEEMHNYIDKLYNRFRLTKNALFTSKPMEFYETYIPLTLKNETTKIDSSKVESFLNDYNKLIIIGAGGSGKTTFLQHVTLDCIKNSYYIPVYIELRKFLFDKTQSFETFVAKSLTKSSFSFMKQIFEQGIFVFIFDGFDEINYKEDQDFIQQIQDFISNYSNNNFIISSRPGTNIESLTQFYVFQLEPLNRNGIRGYLEKLWVPNKLKNSIYSTLVENNFLQYYLTTPLFLQLYIKYVENNLGRNTSYTSSVFFRNILDLLFSKHDSVTKLGYVRNRLSLLSKDELEVVSTMLAFRVLIKSKHSLSKDDLYNEYELIKKARAIEFDNTKITYDLTVAIGILVQDGDYYSFPHILIQEYLASLFISRLDSLKKELVYPNLFGHSFFLSTNILIFLYELDTFSFEKNYLLPLIENMIRQEGFLNFNKNKNLIDFIKAQYLRNHVDISAYDIRHVLEYMQSKFKNEGNDLGEFFTS